VSDSVAALLKLEQKLRSASGSAQLFYAIVNETHQCVPYTQAVLFTGQDASSLELSAASDLPTVDYTSPFVVWMQNLTKSILRDGAPDASVVISPKMLPEHLQSDWNQFSPEHLVMIPLMVAAKEGETVGFLLLFRQEQWIESDRALLDHLGGAMGHALFAWRGRRSFSQLLNKLKQRRVMTILSMLVIAAMWAPVRLSALAPAEVVPQNPVIVAAPINGAVKKVLVEPNQRVNAGDPLVQLDDTELANELAVASQALLVAEAELKTVSQSGFLDPRQKARFAELEAQVKLKEAEQNYAQARFDKALVVAPQMGIAILGDPDQWQGRPVSVGERILSLASPSNVELEIMLPVKDAIALTAGTGAKVFFDSDPLNAYPAKVEHAEYKPVKTPEEVLAFRLVASMEFDDGAPPRIGSRGTAKVYGDDVSLFFYLFRRPITSMRQWFGW